jgi:hypothetical protein
MGEIPRGSNDEVCGRIHRVIVSADPLRVETADGLTGTQNGLAEGVVFPKVGGKDLMDQVIGAVRLHFDLFEDDALFLLNVPVGE